MEINPGENASVDTMESRTPGLVAQSTGRLTSRRIKGSNVFVDKSSDYTHVHHVEDQTLESIMRSKQIMNDSHAPLATPSRDITLIMGASPTKDGQRTASKNRSASNTVALGSMPKIVSLSVELGT